MLKRHGIFTLVYILIVAANLIGQFDGLGGLNSFAKPSICIALAFYLVKNVNFNAGFNRLIFAALIFSLFGDWLLLFAGSRPNFFIFGLVAFLIAQVLYSFAFFRDFKNDPQASKTYGHLMLFVMGVFSLSFYTWIREYLGDLRIPVMAYIFVISMMAILAGYRFQRVNPQSFWLIYCGAIFFVISDSALAYNKFVEEFELAGITIMLTYMVAQYLITIGAIERVVIASNDVHPAGTNIRSEFT